MKFLKACFLLVYFIITSLHIEAQCSLCTKTAQQLGHGPAEGMNTGIIYLAFVPMALLGIIGYRWWKSEKGRKNN